MMEAHNIVLGMISARGNKDSLRWAQAAPDRFRVGYSVDCPSDIDIGELKRLLDSGDVQFVGEVGSQYCGFPVDDPSLAEQFDFAAEHDLIVQLHSHGSFNPRSAELYGNVARLEHGRPTHIEELVIRHPGLRVYFEDAGFPFLDDAVALMRQHPEVYADLANITWMISRDVFHNNAARFLRLSDEEIARHHAR